MGIAAVETTAPFCFSADCWARGLSLVMEGGAGRWAYILHVKVDLRGKVRGRVKHGAGVLQPAGR